MDFYAILGIPRDADDLAIRSAYEALAQRSYHPDAGVVRIQLGFARRRKLMRRSIDPARRQGYDLSLQSAGTNYAGDACAGGAARRSTHFSRTSLFRSVQPV